MKIKTFIVGYLETNCYLVWDQTNNAFVIDPGFVKDDILELFIQFVHDNNLNIKYIVNTHGHADHILCNSFLKNKYNAKICVHKKDASMLVNTVLNLSKSFDETITSLPADILFEDGDDFCVGNMKFKIVSTPGHTQGGICLVTDKVMFTGDTLFNGSIGRTDLPNSSDIDMKNSLEILKKFDPEIIIYPGHGQRSSLKEEFFSNPFFK